MANVIQIKRKTTSGAPSLGDLAVGEFCFVIPDEVLHLKKDVATIVSWGTGEGFSNTDINTLAKVNAIVADATLISETSIDSKISAAIDALIGGAPAALDTLNELASAMADDEAFSATVTAALATKLTANSVIDGGII